LPVITRRAVRAVGSLLATAVLTAALAAPTLAADGDAYVHHANLKRASVGLGPVAWSSLPDAISVERANAVAAGDALVHDFAYVKARLDASGVCYTGYGEIIARSGSFNPASTMEQWWASQVHHDIIVGNYNAAGGSHATSASSRVYSVMIWVKFCSTPPPPPPTATSQTAFARIAGSDRYATAAALSRGSFPSAQTVFIATGASFPDALAGAPAAAAHGSPILLTSRDSLPAPTATELARLRPSRIVILGGPSVVGDAVAGQLWGYARSVERWAGSDRYQTAAAISRATFPAGVRVAYLATGTAFPDALSGGAVAGRSGGPILLVTANSIPDATAHELARLRPQYIMVLGGPSVISEGVRAAAGTFATSGSAGRIAGHDRFATSVAISQSLYGSAGSSAVFVATGMNFPDGLAGGPLAALVPGPILLVSPTQLPESVAAELQRLGPDTVYVIGGPGAVSDGVVGAMDAVLP
jgi:putative cell wall-binding protein